MLVLCALWKVADVVGFLGRTSDFVFVVFARGFLGLNLRCKEELVVLDVESDSRRGDAIATDFRTLVRPFLLDGGGCFGVVLVFMLVFLAETAVLLGLVRLTAGVICDFNGGDVFTAGILFFSGVSLKTGVLGFRGDLVFDRGVLGAGGGVFSLSFS